MSGKRAVLWGASGGVGQALVEVLAASNDYAAIYAGSRSPANARSDIIRPFAFDLLDEPSIAAAAGDIAQQGPVDLVIVATGILHGTTCKPEKSFSSVTSAAMNTLFQVNTVGPTLIAKHMIAALPRDRRSVFAALSARVGSISDNHLGGWHSYRASKAALNMIIANLAIELRRTRPLAIAIGLHPGTVDSKLSAPFQKNVPAGKLFLPSTSAQYLLTVINGTSLEQSGSTLAWDGQTIAT